MEQSSDLVLRKAMSTYAVVIFAILWIGFAVAYFGNSAWLDALWNWVQALPLLAEIIIWVLFLPITVALWIWESSWPVLLRLLGFAGIIGWTLLALYSFVQAWR